MNARSATLGARLQEFDLGVCRRAIRMQDRPLALLLFRVVSRLGDGPAWFALALLLPLGEGAAALPTVGRMAAVGVGAALVSRALKVWTGRPRPCVADAGIAAGAAPLDPWSFPSGHTLHAVAFNLVVAADLPVVALLLLPFTAAVAASRVVLGLHYPSDVAAGALAGAALAAVTLVVL